MIEIRPGGRRRIDRVLDPGYLGDLGNCSLDEVRARRDEADQEETDLSFLRRLLHARIDIVRAEQDRRRHGSTVPVIDELARILAENATGPSASGTARHHHAAPSRAEAHRRYVEALVADSSRSDVAALSDEELSAALVAYRAEESSVSDTRRAVQRVVDACDAEIGRRYQDGSASVDDLLRRERDR